MKYFPALLLGALSLFVAQAQEPSDQESDAYANQMLSMFDAGMLALETQQYDVAYDNFMETCSVGIGTACLNVGIMYSTGIHVEQNEATAGQYYLKACNGTGPDGNVVQQEDIGCHNVAVGYYQGSYGFEMNEDVSAQYFLQACDLGNSDSCYSIGSILRETLLADVLPDEEQGPVLETMLTFFDKSCRLGNADACHQMVLDLGFFADSVESATARGTYVALTCEANAQFGSNVPEAWIGANCPPVSAE